MSEVKASPRSPALGALSDILRRVRDKGNNVRIPLVDLGIGDMLLGKSPEEVDEWAYGNAPLQVVGGGTGSLVPQLKRGRGEQLADTIFAAQGAVPTLQSAGKLAKGALSRMFENTAPSGVRQAGAVRPRSANMLQEGRGSANSAMRDWNRAGFMPPEDREAFIQNMATRHGTNEDALRAGFVNADAHDTWLNSVLKTYIKRDMGTPNDIVRQLFDQGVMHVPLDEIERTASPNFRDIAKSQREWMPEYAGANKDAIGEFGKTPAGRLWEDATDSELYALDAAQIPRSLQTKNPWIDKLNPDELIYSLDRNLSSTDGETVLGLKQLSDMVMSALADGTLTPEKLKQFSMEKAVRMANDQRLAAEAERLAKQKAMAEFVGAQGRLHKEYPEQGLKWVQLELPEQLDDYTKSFIRKNDEGWYTPYGPDGEPIAINLPGGGRRVVSEPTMERAQLGGMLANEGNAMGHCVGGYCGDVAAGKSRIFSLRDAKGNPHVTIETTPGIDPFGGTIEQIKGNSNLKPNDEYLPAVQDFIRSQKWDSIGDLHNTGLNRVGDRYFTQTELDEIQANIKHPDYLYLMDNMKPGYKDGGHVELDDDFAYPGMF